MAIRVLLAALSVAAGCGHCGQRGDSSEPLQTYVNEVCACKDMDCVIEAGNRHAAKRQGDARSSHTPSGRMAELVARMAECNRRFMDQAVRTAEPPPGR